MQKPIVGIVILNYKNSKDTFSCVESLFKSNFKDFVVCVVDNFSNVSEQEAISSVLGEFPSVHLLLLDHNRGFSVGNNEGLRFLQKMYSLDYFWILNNDTIVFEDTLGTLVSFAKENSKYLLIGNLIKYYHNPFLAQGVGGVYDEWVGTVKHIGEGPVEAIQASIVKKVQYPIGASMFVKKEFLEKVGYLTEDHFLFFEELDWVKRGEKHFKDFVGICIDAEILHKEGASYSNGQNEKSKIADFYFIKNRIWMTFKYFPYAVPSIYLLSLGVIFNRLIRKQYDRVWMILGILLGKKHF